MPGSCIEKVFRMKKVLSFVSLLLVLVSCNTNLQPANPEPQPKTAAGLVFHASFEAQYAPGTKVFMDESWQLRWNAGDAISVFDRTVDNLPFGFSGEEGATSGSFSPASPDATMEGAEVPGIYAVYPHDAGTAVASDGTISLTLPAEQVYYGGVSFGRGANTMVSVTGTEQEKLLFRNVCGYLQIKLYGENVAVSRVTLKGNKEELLAGAAAVTATADGVPTVTMQTGATKEIAIVCSEPIPVGADAEHYTTFMLAVPPTTFAGGFTITVTDSDGFVTEQKTTKSYTVERNAILPMAPFSCREIEAYNIENAGVRNYMANVDYTSDPSYTQSAVDQYKSTASDDPLPFTVTVSGARQIHLKSLSDRYPREWTVTGSDSFQIYNLIPGVVYHYDVRNAAGTSLKSGFVRPAGQVRMINGFSYNVRDLGGWQASGGTIAYGKLYRGAQLEGISSSGKEVFLDDLGISVDLDLRGYNGSGTPARVLDASRCVYENLQLWKFLGKGTGTTQELHQKAIRDIIGWLSEGKNVYFHCIGGADRTGTLAFLIEALLGVSESDLSKDYELTSFDGTHSRKRNDNASTNPDYIFTWLINYLRSDTFGGTSGSINTNVENWAKTRHSQAVDPLTDEEIATLRRLLVVTE